MKQMKPFISSVVACGIALAMVTSLAAQSTQDGAAKVVRISGSARYMPVGATTWEPLKTGALLAPGTVVQTASGSYVDLVLNGRGGASGVGMAAAGGAGAGAGASPISYNAPKARQNAVRIFENTVLGIDKLSEDQTGAETVTDTELDLKAGKILGTVSRLSAASKYEVKIPNGVAGIRGTTYVLTSDGLLQVLGGQVVLAYVGPNGTTMTQVVDAGYQFDAKTGQLTKISDEEMSTLVPIAGSFQPAQMGPSVFTVDHTLYYVSPTQQSGGFED